MTGHTVTARFADEVVDAQHADRVEALFDTHQPRLYRLARRLAPTADDARDLVQETFLRVARTPHVVPQGTASEEAWLVRVLVNIQRDEWRRSNKRRGWTSRVQLYQPNAASPDQEAALIARTTVQRALERIPPRRRAVIVLHELEGASIHSIAAWLGITAVTVRWHLSRGRRELAALIVHAEEKMR